MTGTPIQLIQWLYNQDKHKLFDISEHTEKRSKNANSYCWVLCQKIADVIRSSKEEVYLENLKRYGQCELWPLVHGTDPEQFFRGITKYYEFYDYGILNGKECDWFKVFRGSSSYTTSEMSVFIDGLVSEAQELGIETATPLELARMKEKWQ